MEVADNVGRSIPNGASPSGPVGRLGDMLRQQPDLGRRDATWIFGVICSLRMMSFG
jgi:hypothetical protein